MLLTETERFSQRQNFVKDCRQRINNILETLGWSEENVFKNYHANSVTESKKSKDNKNALNKSCSTFPDSCTTKNSVVLETPELRKLLLDPEVEAPRNFIDLQANFLRDQKLKIYEYVIANTERLVLAEPKQIMPYQMSFSEIVAQKRKEKCRKRKYRTSKPTHVEEVRALVDLQMQAFHQFLNQNRQSDNGNTQSTEDKNNKYRTKNHRISRERYKEYNNYPKKSNFTTTHGNRHRKDESKDRKNYQVNRTGSHIYISNVISKKRDCNAKERETLKDSRRNRSEVNNSK